MSAGYRFYLRLRPGDEDGSGAALEACLDVPALPAPVLRRVLAIALLASLFASAPLILRRLAASERAEPSSSAEPVPWADDYSPERVELERAYHWRR